MSVPFNELEQVRTEVFSLRKSEEILKKNLEQTENHLIQLKSENSRLHELMRLMKHQIYGKKSEVWKDLPSTHLQLDFGIFNEIEALEKASQESKEDSETLTQMITYTKKVNRGKRAPLPKELPREEVLVEVPESERICPQDGAPLVEIGEEVSEKLKVIPEQMIVVRTIKKKYGCKKCTSHVILAKGVPDLFPKSIATSELVSYLISKKFDYATPLYRMEDLFKFQNLHLSRTSMARWMIQASEKLVPIWNVLEELVLDQGYSNIDATRVQVLKEKGRSPESKSAMWVRGSSELGIVLFDYDPSEGGVVAERLLTGFHGFVQSDQHQGYNRLNKDKNIIRVGCWAHARRRFFQAYKEGAQKGKTLAEEGLKKIQNLYAVEEESHSLTKSERFDLRKEKSLPLLSELKIWCQKIESQIPPKSQIFKAVHYVLEQWDYLNRYLDNGRLQIDNNWIERQIKSFAIGRKNWLFSDTVEGAKASALLYSLVVTAKNNGHDSYQVILEILKELPYAQTIEDYEALAKKLL